MHTCLLIFLLATQSLAAPTNTPNKNAALLPRQTYSVLPQLKQATILANVTQPSIDRDSCGSSRIGSRAFWTCRDTQRYDPVTMKDVLPLAASTGGWTDLDASGPRISSSDNPIGVASSGNNSIHLMYGEDPNDLEPYFPFQQESCPPNGVCSDGTRFVVWPNQPPLVTQSNSRSATAYSWVAKEQLSGLTSLSPQPAYTLYKMSWSSSSNRNSLPTVTTVADNFWKIGQIGFGQYGSVIRDGYAYLYGQLPNVGGTVLARVPTAAIDVEDRSAYRFYVQGKWVPEVPSITDTSNVIPNAGTGWQGTFYYSSAYSSYIWIGQQVGCPVADFWITTAPAPEGPWVQPYKLWSGPNGDGFVGAYSLQAHPALLPSLTASEKGIYLTYTQQWDPKTLATYVTPLVYLEFQ